MLRIACHRLFWIRAVCPLMFACLVGCGLTTSSALAQDAAVPPKPAVVPKKKRKPISRRPAPAATPATPPAVQTRPDAGTKLIEEDLVPVAPPTPTPAFDGDDRTDVPNRNP